MSRAEWGAEPELFGPRHLHRQRRILGALARHRCLSGLHLECAAGVGALALALARAGREVIAADASLRSLAVVRRRAFAAGLGDRLLPVVADITALPFATATFASATTAETLEHVDDDARAVAELARTLRDRARLVGTTPGDPDRWSDWDEWAGHVRRYTPRALAQLLTAAGLSGEVRIWGWPLLRLYDRLFLARVVRRRLAAGGPFTEDRPLRAVARLGRCRWLVSAVAAMLALDRPFDRWQRGAELLFSATRLAAGPRRAPSARRPGSGPSGRRE